MRIHVVSDVHGSADALARAGRRRRRPDLPRRPRAVPRLRRRQRRASSRACSAPRTPRRFVELRTAGRFDEARAWAAGLWDDGPRARGPRPRTILRGERARAVRRAVRRDADARRTSPTATSTCRRSGPDYLRPGHTVLDGEVVEIGGLRVGFVGGGLVSPMRTPYELDEATYAAKVDGARRGRRAVRAHPARRCRSCATTSSPGGSSTAAARSSSTCARPSRGWCCSATCTSRWCAGPGSAAPSASTSATSAAGRTPFSLSW